MPASIGAMPDPITLAMRTAAADAGTWIVIVTLAALPPAGKVDGVIVTMDPVGAPVAVSVAVAGNVVPAEGLMVRE